MTTDATTIAVTSPRDAAAVVAQVRRDHGSPCHACSRPVCGHEVVVSVLAGHRGTIRCLACTALDLGLDAAEALESAWRHVRARDCFLAGWEEATTLETAPHGPWSCALDRVTTPVATSAATRDTDVRQDAEASVERDASASLPGDADASMLGEDAASFRWNAGDLACGELLLELRRRLASIPEGSLFELVALDPSAPEDIPAWCGLTGHDLLVADHPRYRIRARTRRASSR